MRAGYIAAAVLVGVAAAGAMTPDAMAALEMRTAARHRLATLEAQVAAARMPQPPLVASDLSLRASDADIARTKLSLAIKRAAARQGVLVESLRAIPGPDGLVELSVRLSGNEKAVLALADQIERQKPLTRFTKWRVEAVAQGQVRFDGQLVTPWQR